MKQIKQIKQTIVLALLIGFIMTSCNTVKAYERIKLNDKEMALVPKLSARFELQFHTYREAASGANGGKTGGGCGCN
ncbi:MAG: hypothetical protein CO023_00310 [Flavobacteriales bacterium CG_4_9_14_0_2_um_filter_35_242]|nr:DUF4266 domain-containing protein [Zetaproteobacteria bacterium]OIO11486.1 MAG: hypothetical protein AUJ53_04425 [Flavobacteriaceae bacterium CG1_02_35_72]PIR13730.1 MAG: hypothetical protein COV50_05500 [Flavobacteriales bacterium CG11_big_fil_rev_8_21_14_0_20_35_7]PIV18712.1 MAG: hypothetical protein COS42_01520 [Flavobacteriales bacterium CG03_land_8_20_14_0_80_35_15]PIX07005.1 MAG: hypothetical protein COZ76_05785 [Flavobacteriales bacterium CG_4_8_14_3_um_filter_35_10]PJA06875.1 MAG: h